MYILFDIGGTKTRIAFSAAGETFEEPKVLPTSKNYEEGLKLFIDAVKEVAGSREIEKIVGGVSRSTVFGDYDKFKSDLGALSFGEAGEHLGKAEIVVENDAAMAGLGEANFGAGQGFEIVAYITVSTGVGGARIVNGKIDEHAIGFEPGKQIVDINPNRNLEDLISGRALTQRTGKKPQEITDPNIWDEHAKFLAIGLHNIIVEWSPSVLVLGGSMITGDPAIPLGKTEQYLKEILKIFPTLPIIKKAELADFGGLWGAMTYLK